MSDSWEVVLARSRQEGFRIQPLDSRSMTEDWAHIFENEPPPSVQAFVNFGIQDAPDLWRILVDSAVSVHPDISDVLSDPSTLLPLRSLLERVEHAAIVYGHGSDWHSPDQWGYLLQIRHAQRVDQYEQVLLHPPANPRDLERAEQVLAVTLPPSYRRFLLLTNGLGLGETEDSHICGAGPQRADWSAVLLNLWMQCGGQHEIAAQWREFQGIYAYERIMDRERGEQTFQSDETALIPFAYTYEAWCFDRTRPNDVGEYPIVLWDHELRGATDRYPDFDAWFAGELEPYLFGDD